MLINRRKKPTQRLFSGLTGSVLTGPPTIEPAKRGRPSISNAAMTAAERQRKSRENKKARKNSLPAAPTTSPAVMRRWDEIIRLIEGYRKTCSVIRPAARYLRKLVRNDFLELAEEDQVGHLNGLIGILTHHIELIVWRRENPELARAERKPAVAQISFYEFMKQLEERAKKSDRGQLILDTRRLLGVKVPVVKTGLVTSGNIEKLDASQHQKESGNAFMRRKKVRNYETEFDEVDSFQPSTFSPLSLITENIAESEHDVEGAATDDKDNQHVGEKDDVAGRTNPSRNEAEKYAAKHPGVAVKDPYADLWCQGRDTSFCAICGRQFEGIHHRGFHTETHSRADIHRFKDWRRTNLTDGLTPRELWDLYRARWERFRLDRSEQERKLLKRVRPQNDYNAGFFRDHPVADEILRTFCRKWRLFS